MPSASELILTDFSNNYHAKIIFFFFFFNQKEQLIFIDSQNPLCAPTTAVHHLSLSPALPSCSSPSLFNKVEEWSFSADQQRSAEKLEEGWPPGGEEWKSQTYVIPQSHNNKFILMLFNLSMWSRNGNRNRKCFELQLCFSYSWAFQHGAGIRATSTLLLPGVYLCEPHVSDSMCLFVPFICHRLQSFTVLTFPFELNGFLFLYGANCLFPLSVYLIVGLIVMLVVLETFCELQQLKQLRKMFYLKKEKQKDRIAILEHDQLSFSSVSKAAASSNEDNRHMFGSTTTLVPPRSDMIE